MREEIKLEDQSEEETPKFVESLPIFDIESCFKPVLFFEPDDQEKEANRDDGDDN